MLGCVVAFNLLKAGLAISGAITTVGNAMALSDGVDYGGGFNGVIEVPLYVNGREFAKATSGDMENELNNRTRMSNRKQGRI